MLFFYFLQLDPLFFSFVVLAGFVFQNIRKEKEKKNNWAPFPVSWKCDDFFIKKALFCEILLYFALFCSIYCAFCTILLLFYAVLLYNFIILCFAVSFIKKVALKLYFIKFLNIKLYFIKWQNFKKILNNCQNDN